ncbi:chorismate-binding protein [uncultured Spirosoma sp.]|uniref:chorismate-binding protein n=1 Tax=uncultured Spirosoma sp. TaxID=278208 RepID=UPI00258ABA72|nr:chorismate-binding protein [uncultured Spirosoma sp.]
MHVDVTTDTTVTSRPTAVDLWETARSLGMPAALWRLPNQREKHSIVSFEETLPRVVVDLDELPAGFVVSRFDSQDEGPDKPARSLFIRADVQAIFPEDGPARVTYTTQPSHAFQQSLAHPPLRPTPAPSRVTVRPDTQHAAYVDGVTQAIDAMQQGSLRKVVLSRTKQVDFADVPDAVALFDRLCVKYPTAFVSAVSIPELGQIWLSATPERLISQRADGIFETMALAGTQSATFPDGTAKRPAEAMWSQKEIEEQAMVCRYIIECFKKIRLREYLEVGPKTIIAGNLMHLSTCFTVDTQAVHYPQLSTVMLRLLHPTSAVCGTPRDKAMDFIQQHEPHDRELYAGFIGPVNCPMSEDGPASHLFVHLRCMKLEGKLATLYAGAGLTEDSVPEREWQETEMKCQTLLSVLNE